MLVTRLLLVLEIFNVNPTHRKSWAGNLEMKSGLTLDPSLKVKQRQPKLKVLITRLLLVPEVCNVKPTYRKISIIHGLGITFNGQLWSWAPLSTSNNGSLALVCCFSGGYKFGSLTFLRFQKILENPAPPSPKMKKIT